MNKFYIGLVSIAFSVTGLLYCFAFTDTLDSAVNFVSAISRSPLEVREAIEERLGMQSNTKKSHRCSTEADRKELDDIIGRTF